MKEQVYKVPYFNDHGYRLVTITGVYPEPRRITRVGVVTVNEPHDRFSVYEFQLEAVDVAQADVPYHGLVWRIKESAPDDAEALYEMNPTSRVIY